MIEEFRKRIKKFLKTPKNFKNKNWEIVWMDMDEIEKDTDTLNVHWPKALTFAYKIKDGVIFPPIILKGKNSIYDGTTRLGAYYLAEETKVPVLISVENKEGKHIGNGTLLGDKVYLPMIESFKEKDFYLPDMDTKEIECMGCKGTMTPDKPTISASKNFVCSLCEVWTDIVPTISWPILPK